MRPACAVYCQSLCRFSSVVIMNEIEIKILEIDVEETIDKLTSLGAEKIFDGEVCAFFYDTLDRRLASQNRILRLRVLGDKVELVLKEKLESDDDVKARLETELYVSDLETAKTLLGKLGYSLVGLSTKHRISYKLPDVKFEIDQLAGIPAYLEIEANNPNMLRKYVLMLGFTMGQTRPWSTEDVLKYYSKPQKQ